MTRPDSAHVEQALVATLAADVELGTYLPDGVYFDMAEPGSTAYTLVTLLTHADVAIAGGRAAEDYRFLVLGVTRDRRAVRDAAARIDALLEDGALTPAGFVLQEMHREARVRERLPDDVDPDVLWQYRGGRYRVRVALGAGAPPTDLVWEQDGWTKPGWMQ